MFDLAQGIVPKAEEESCFFLEGNLPRYMGAIASRAVLYCLANEGILQLFSCFHIDNVAFVVHLYIAFLSPNAIAQVCLTLTSNHLV
jgi:hypothetical protein